MGAAAAVDVVVKLGGGALGRVEHVDAVLRLLEEHARHRRLLVVPGGGPFADAVRSVDRAIGLSADAAHWMAVLAMDQYAHLLASRARRATLVTHPETLVAPFGAGRLPILAPSRWLRSADPLPHTWDVTSDSIAAWVAGAVGARRLVLVKPPGAHGADVVDAHFARALPAGVEATIVPADAADALRAALDGAPRASRPAR